MTKKDIFKKANEFASDALEMMHKESLAPTPENYELWYVYFAGSNPELTRALTPLVEKKQPITDEICAELHQRFLTDSRESQKVRSAGDRIQKTIKEVNSAVKNSQTIAGNFDKSLSGMQEQLNEDISAEDMKALVGDVKASTEEVLKNNNELQAKLDQSAVAMAALHQDLEQVRQEALTDGLTKLSNRKAFDQEIRKLIDDCSRESRTFSLIMLDIDHFKAFNDNFGHQIGDHVLRLVSQTLIEGVKGKDITARYGGEEFAILLPDTPLEGAKVVADKLRKAVAIRDVVNRTSGETLGRITLSCGVAEHFPGEEAEDVIERADSALYTAKHNGRNQIAAAPSPSSGSRKKA